MRGGVVDFYTERVIFCTTTFIVRHGRPWAISLASWRWRFLTTAMVVTRGMSEVEVEPEERLGPKRAL